MEVFTFCAHDTPIGPLTSVRTPVGLARIEFGVSPEAGWVEGDHGDVDKQIAQYFAGERRAFDLVLDWRFTRGFLREGQEALTRIPYGETVTYSQLAAMAGRPNAVRAAGTACAKNPLPVVVPCHRVVRSDGSVGNYAGGSEVKRFLLDLEAEHG